MSQIEGRLPKRFTPIEELVSVKENERLKKSRERKGIQGQTDLSST